MHGQSDSQRRTIAFEDVREAAQHVYEAALRTPLVRFDFPDAAPEIYLKLENLQPIGSFKLRGAYNAVRKMPAPERARGVWTVSAGNAAQGVAFAARRAGVPCRVLVMDTAPQAKLDAIKRLGATYVLAPFDECWTALQERRHPRMQGTFVHPFEDDDFIAGNASVGLEILEDLPDVDAVVAAFGGGGLVAAIATVMKELRPAAKVYAAEPETAAPLRYSIEMGSPQVFANWQSSFVDGAGGKSVFPRMWALANHLVTGSIVVPLDEIRRAMRIAAERAHIVAEGAGALALAAALTGRAGNGKIVAVISGGNIDLARFCELISAP